MLFFSKKTTKDAKKKKAKKSPTRAKAVMATNNKKSTQTKNPRKKNNSAKNQNEPIAIKKYTNDSQKPHKDYNSIDVEWLEKKLQNTNKKRVQMLASDHQEATVKYIKALLRSDKQGR